MNLVRQQLAELKGVLTTGCLSSYTASPSGNMGGNKVQELESLFCDYFSVKHSIAMNSATSCLFAACLAGRIHKVLVPVVTFSASASCVLQAGGTVEFADINPATYNMDLESISGADKIGLSGIIPVHLHGCPCCMTFVRERGIFTIEDCSQAIGATYQGHKAGTIGDCGVFSFNQNKIIQSGEGGMIITNDDELARKLRLIRNHGETRSDILGYNLRLTELQAAVLIPQMRMLDKLLDYRIELADRLTERLRGIEELTLPQIPPNSKHVYTTYPVKVNGISRNILQKSLLTKGVYFGNGGYKPLHLFPFYGGHEGQFPNAEECYQTVMYTNILRPPLKVKDVDVIAEKVKESIWEVSH